MAGGQVAGVWGNKEGGKRNKNTGWIREEGERSYSQNCSTRRHYRATENVRTSRTSEVCVGGALWVPSNVGAEVGGWR